jgi:hypothetical protein
LPLEWSVDQGGDGELFSSAWLPQWQQPFSCAIANGLSGPSQTGHLRFVMHSKAKQAASLFNRDDGASMKLDVSAR